MATSEKPAVTPTMMEPADVKVEAIKPEVSTFSTEKPSKEDKVTVSAVPPAASDTTAVAPPKSTGTWKITIKNDDGTTNEVLLARNPPVETDVAVAAVAAPPTRQLRIYVVCQHLLTGLTSIVIIFIMILTLVQYNNSSKVAGAWPAQPLLSPTYVMLAVSVVSLLADAISLGMQCFGGNIATKAKTYTGYVKSFMNAIQLIVNAAGTGIFKGANANSGGRDLWGWSCTSAADAHSDINASSTLCNTNQVAYGLSILQIILHALSVAMVVFSYWKPKGKVEGNLDDAKGLIDQESGVAMSLGGGDGK